MSENLDYVLILKAVNDIPFSVGKKLLIDVLRGEKDNGSVIRNRLDELYCFGTMIYSENEIKAIIDNLLMNGLLDNKELPMRRFCKVLSLTEKGKKEIENPEHYKKKAKLAYKKTHISEQEKAIFKQMDFFLGKYDDEQKKAIINPAEKILCIAGAGSGKTTVLTKRIEFLTQLRSVDPGKILAITFTRKARQEMLKRLADNPNCMGVKVETFNSFSEKILQQHNDLLYDKKVSMLSYGEKIKIVHLALKSINIDMARAVNSYFSITQKKYKTSEELQRIFINDCFSILDYYKNENKEIEDFSQNELLSGEDKSNASMVYRICKYITELMTKVGKRDFCDQVVDCVKLFEKNKKTTPKFDYILIDEYQDVNSVQIKLVDVLDAKNIFCVGDPRQSIFGWRGSKIQYVLNFEEKYPDSEVIFLTTNYRSPKGLVELFNESIRSMNLPDLESNSGSNCDITMLNFSNEGAEHDFVINDIINNRIEAREIFVLARTNRQLKELSSKMKQKGIDHIIRSDEIRKPADDSERAVTLATIHAIKGLEARKVFVVGCSPNNFPCKTTDHPIMDIVKLHEYDKEEEERRLFYVAISRAKESLVLSYSSSNQTWFINDKMKSMIKGDEEKKPNDSGDVHTKLRSWRNCLAKKNGMPAYCVFNDRTLQELAENRPMSIDELDDINGLGAAKIRRYGKAIVKITSG